MGSRYAEGYGLIVFASALLLWGLCSYGSREKCAYGSREKLAA